jgi:ribosomal protein L37E
MHINNKIICKNCNKESYNDYYDFCSSMCFCDFASKNELFLWQLKKMSIENSVREVEEDYRKMERDLEHDIVILEKQVEDLKDKYE